MATASKYEPNPRLVTNDVRQEPNQMLKPIKGYENEELVSLEKACEPLKDLVNDLDENIWIAKRNSKYPENNLTQDESASIHLYTMEWNESDQSLYAILNRTLRQADRRGLIPWFKYLKLFLTALYKLPSVT